MTLATFPPTSLGAARAPGDKLAPGISRVPCPDDAVWRALRSKDVTASVAAALLKDQDGRVAHEWETPYSLFMAKTGRATDHEETPAMKRGRLLEPVAVQVLREDHPNWIIRHNSGESRVYYRDANSRIGATPDVEVYDPERGPGVVQVKSVESTIYRKKWFGEDRELTPPLWIAVQAVIEAALKGAQWAAVAPIVVGHGVDVPLIDIPLHAGVMARIRNEVADFWQRVAEDDPPPPDYGRDGDLIAGLYADDDGSETNIVADDALLSKLTLREHFLAVEKAARAAEEARATIDAELRYLLKNAVRGRLPDGRIIEAKTTRVKGRTQIIEPYSFRAIKVKEAKS